MFWWSHAVFRTVFPASGRACMIVSGRMASGCFRPALEILSGEILRDRARISGGKYAFFGVAYGCSGSRSIILPVCRFGLSAHDFPGRSGRQKPGKMLFLCRLSLSFAGRIRNNSPFFRYAREDENVRAAGFVTVDGMSGS